MLNDINIGILALKTNSPEYKITYALQKTLNAFVKIAKEYTDYSVYRVKLQNDFFLLINNRAGKKYFFPKLKEFNFIIKCEIEKKDLIKEKIKQINEILYIMNINEKEIPKKYLTTLSLLE